jgi:RNA polymerase sigma factor (sigma-70 family)
VVTEGGRLGAATAPDSTSTTATAVDIRALVATLPPRERAVVVLYYLEDLSVADTARLLKIKEGTVKAHLSHARAALRVTAAADRTEAS